MKQNYNIEEAVVIYSIVNSLSELSAINKVPCIRTAERIQASPKQARASHSRNSPYSAAAAPSKNYSCNSILLSLNAGDYSIGEILCVKGTAQTFSLPVNEGNFNERAYYQS